MQTVWFSFKLAHKTQESTTIVVLFLLHRYKHLFFADWLWYNNYDTSFFRGELCLTNYIQVRYTIQMIQG